MEQDRVPLVREFSALEPYQEACTLVCTLEPGEQGCWLVVRRCKASGSPETEARSWVAATETECRRLLRFLYENSVQPELWQDAIASWYPQTVQADIPQEGGASCELR